GARRGRRRGAPRPWSAPIEQAQGCDNTHQEGHRDDADGHPGEGARSGGLAHRLPPDAVGVTPASSAAVSRAAIIGPWAGLWLRSATAARNAASTWAARSGSTMGDRNSW